MKDAGHDDRLARPTSTRQRYAVRSALLVSSSILLLACGDDPATTACTDTLAPTDTSAPRDTAPTDTLAPTDTSGPAPAEGERFVLDDGRVIEGELVATYDHARWWTPTPGTTYAVFDPERYAEWPDDRSLVFVDGDAVTAREPLRLPADRPRYLDWLAARGLGIATTPLTEPALVITAHEDHHLAEHGYGDFAWDLVLTDADGARWHGDGRALEDYLSWGAAITSPVAGLVVEVVGDAPDRAPGEWPAEGIGARENLVGIHLAGAFHVYLLHLAEGSIPPEVAPHSPIAAGDPIGRVGNSGTTLEPHLHLAMLAWDFERERFWSVPAEFFDVHLARDGAPAAHHARIDPARGDRVDDAPF